MYFQWESKKDCHINASGAPIFNRCWSFIKTTIIMIYVNTQHRYNTQFITKCHQAFSRKANNIKTYNRYDFIQDILNWQLKHRAGQKNTSKSHDVYRYERHNHICKLSIWTTIAHWASEHTWLIYVRIFNGVFDTTDINHNCKFCEIWQQNTSKLIIHGCW